MENFEITLTHDNFSSKLLEFTTAKKAFFIFAYGAHGPNGLSWCPDCDKSQPFVLESKNIVEKKQNTKQVYFINIPIEKAERPDYTNDKILRLTKVPSLMYYENGREMIRIVEEEMDNQEKISGFIEQIYD